MDDYVIPVYRGRGLNQLFKMRAPDGTYYPITGVSFTIFEVFPARLAGVFSVAPTGGDAYEGRMIGAWSEEWPPEEGDGLVWFRAIPSDPNYPFLKIKLRLL